jgi:large subunit ribosomal protein L11
MVSQSVDAMIPGGKATASPPLGPALGPLGVNIGQVVSEINKKTAAFNGMQVPVKVIVDTDTKEFEISIGTPPASALILKEANIQKGSGTPHTDKVADLLIPQIIKIAKMKEDGMLGKDLKARVKEIIGTCNSMGILVGGKPAVEAIKDVNEGKYDKEIKEEKTELSAEEMKKLEEEKKKLAEEMEARRAEFEAKAKEVLKEMEGKERGEIKAKMAEEGIPDAMIKEFLPVEGEAAAEGKEGEKPAEGKAEEKKEEPAKEEKK